MVSRLGRIVLVVLLVVVEVVWVEVVEVCVSVLVLVMTGTSNLHKSGWRPWS